MKKNFSVIIPVYNAEKTIHRCLDSLLKQHDGKAEIILVNDGSIDRSAEICLDYASKYECIVYIEQENAGASSARNAGLSAATGEYITFVDSDDYVADGYFEALEKFNDDLIVFSYQAIRSHEVVCYTFPDHLLNADSNLKVILGVIKSRIAGPCNKRFKRSVIEENELVFKKDLIIGEDFIFGLEYMLSCKSSQIMSQPLYWVDETSPNSITRSGKYDFTQFLRIYEYAFQIAEKSSWEAGEKQMLLQQLDYLYCRTAFSSIEYCIYVKPNAAIHPNVLVKMYCEQYNLGIRPVNLVHAIMRVCVRFRIVPAFVCIAFLHNLLLSRKKCSCG